MSKTLESFLLGLLIGTCVTLVVGFGYYGWKTPGKGAVLQEKESDKAVVNALSAICVERFKTDPAYNSNLLKLKNTDPFTRGDFLEIGGWSKFSTSSSFELEISTLCANILLSEGP